MPNPQKQRGTRFESAVVWYLQEHTGGITVERQALAGANDKGDIKFTLPKVIGIAECKYRKGGLHTPKELEEYKAQTLNEIDNACARFGVLITNDRSGSSSKGSASVGANKCYIRFADLLKLTGIPTNESNTYPGLGAVWCCITLEEFARYLQIGMCI